MACYSFDRLRTGLGFDPERGFAFSTYAWPAIQRRVWRAVKSHTPAALPAPSPPPDPDQVWAAAQIHKALEEPDAWDYLSNFEVVLYLVDFDPLRPVLAQLLG